MIFLCHYLDLETPHFSHLRKVKDVHIDLPHTSACPSPFQSHPCSMAEAEAVDDLDLLERLKGSESLQEQADIIHYLHKTKCTLLYFQLLLLLCYCEHCLVNYSLAFLPEFSYLTNLCFIYYMYK